MKNHEKDLYNKRIRDMNSYRQFSPKNLLTLVLKCGLKLCLMDFEFIQQSTLNWPSRKKLAFCMHACGQTF